MSNTPGSYLVVFGAQNATPKMSTEMLITPALPPTQSPRQPTAAGRIQGWGWRQGCRWSGWIAWLPVQQPNSPSKNSGLKTQKQCAPEWSGMEWCTAKWGKVKTSRASQAAQSSVVQTSHLPSGIWRVSTRLRMLLWSILCKHLPGLNLYYYFPSFFFFFFALRLPPMHPSWLLSQSSLSACGCLLAFSTALRIPNSEISIGNVCDFAWDNGKKCTCNIIFGSLSLDTRTTNKSYTILIWRIHFLPA